MKHRHSLYVIVALAVLVAVIANGQTPRNANRHYEKDGLSFDYPDGWGVTENSSQGMLTVTLAKRRGVSQMIVSTQEGFTPTCDFQSKRNRIAEALIEKVAAQIHASTPQRIPVAIQIDGSEVEGVQLQGVVERKQVTAEVYSARVHGYFISLSRIHAANDEPAKSAWNAVRTTLTVRQPVLTIGTSEENSAEPATASDLVRGQLVTLPKPDYPRIAKSAHASGSVTVQVTIDETGKVIAAHAVSGHPLLQAASVEAAKLAKFSVTRMCGEPVRVAGIITYSFVAQ